MCTRQEIPEDYLHYDGEFLEDEEEFYDDDLHNIDLLIDELDDDE